ncbi:MAG: hypothetical protein QOF21_3350 [Actinomycetota bacterium]
MTRIGAAIAAVITSIAALLGAGAPPRASLTASPPCHATNWASFGNGITRTFASPDTCITKRNAPLLRPKWFFNAKSPVTGQPAVVDGIVYFGTYRGNFHAVRADTGKAAWPAPFPAQDYDHEVVDFGVTPGSPTVATIDGRKLVIFPGGATLFALDAMTGALVDKLCLDRVDTTCMGKAGFTTEVETSPAVVLAPDAKSAQVLVGLDVNEHSPAGPAGMISLKLDRDGFHPDWWFDPEAGETYRGLAPTMSMDNLIRNGCNDVWSSAAVDLSTNTVSFGTRNCPHPERVRRAPGVTLPELTEGIVGVDLTTGAFRWQNRSRPAAEGFGLDLDYGATPNVLAPGIVAEGGKDGLVTVTNANTGALVWRTQVASGSDIGGIIASTAVGKFSNGHQAVFADSAIPFHTRIPRDSINHNVRHPLHILGVHAIDITSRFVKWHAAVGPSYGAPVFGNGLLFVPDTFTDSLVVLDANTGVPLRVQPLNVPPAGPPAISGNSVYMGAGISENIQGLEKLAYLGGVWAFTTVP